MTWRQRTYHIIYGLHSNIPLCCVLFFTFFSRRALSAQHMNSVERNRKYMARQYVPCPRCLRTGYTQRLHYCGHSCKPLYVRLCTFAGWTVPKD